MLLSNKQINNRIKLFLMAFAQVFMVVANTYFIANNGVGGIIIAGFFINYIWTHNVRKVAFGNEWDRLIYTSGAVLGSISGYFTAKVVNF